MKEITTEEYLSISRTLEKHHALFYMAWKMGRPVFNEHISTACVCFDREGDFLRFEFNPTFWDSLDDYNRAFVIAHECLHVILNHGFRTKNMKEHTRCNIALDVVVNHSLVNNFGFERTKIHDADNFCWVDTVFKQNTPPDDKYFEYYYQMMPPTKYHTLLVDDHSGLSDIDWQSTIDKLGEGLSDEEKVSVRGILEGKVEQFEASQAGKGAGGLWQYAVVGKVQSKKKWETVIKKWSKKFDRNKFKDVEQWARLNRRFSMLSGDMILPTDMEIEDDPDHKKIEVWFFQDTSGSCRGYINRFFSAALSLPKDRFDVKLHCFDTEVYETSLETKKLYGFGGTSFNIIESYIQIHIKKHKLEYPEAVFVITDGFGNNVYPQVPQKWHWFLTSSYRRCIPKECNVYNLKDYE